MPDHTIRILIADDHPAALLGVESVIEGTPALQLVGSVRNSTELIRSLDRHPCDVLVSDLSMPGGDHGDGIMLIRSLVKRYPHLRIAVLTMLDDASLLRSLAMEGISGILSKADDLHHITAAIQIAFAGGRYHSPTVKALLQPHSMINSPSDRLSWASR